MAISDKSPQNRAVFDAHGKMCPYCSRTMDRGNLKLMPTADHIVAKSVQFKGMSKNVQRKRGRKTIVCSECNFMKATFTLEEFIIDLRRKNDLLLASVDTNLSRMRNIRYLLDIGLEE